MRQNIMGAVTALNTLSVFEYNQIGDDVPVVNQGVNLQEECRSPSSVRIGGPRPDAERRMGS